MCRNVNRNDRHMTSVHHQIVTAGQTRARRWGFLAFGDKCALRAQYIITYPEGQQHQSLVREDWNKRSSHHYNTSDEVAALLYENLSKIRPFPLHRFSVSSHDSQLSGLKYTLFRRFFLKRHGSFFPFFSSYMRTLFDTYCVFASLLCVCIIYSHVLCSRSGFGGYEVFFYLCTYSRASKIEWSGGLGIRGEMGEC